MCWCYVCDRATAQWETLSSVEVMERDKKGAGARLILRFDRIAPEHLIIG